MTDAPDDAPRALAMRIEHTLLAPEATAADADRLVAEALEFGFVAVCVNGRLLARVRERLEQAGGAGGGGSGGGGGGAPLPRACAVAGFPLGAGTPMALAMEATLLVKAGAQEIDVVAWLPRLLAVREARDADAASLALRDDLIPMVRAVRAADAQVVVKVILETGALRAACAPEGAGPGDAPGALARFERMIEAGCRAARESGCEYVKTSTGFHPAGGATVEAVALMKKHAGALRVKASAGIRTREDALRMIEAGAERIGTSSGVRIVRG